METKPKPIINLTEIPIETIELNGANAKMTITRYLRNIELTFICNINGDIDNEVSYTFKNADYATIEQIHNIFEGKTMFSIYDIDKDLEIEIGIISTNSVQIAFGLLDYSYDSTKPSKAVKYNITIKEGDINYQRLNLLISLISKRLIKNKEEISDDNKLDNTEYPRQSQL